ncbi:ABC transporter permease [Paenibacillus cremeus]|uniref:Sugar ABC transporter permease n=1 Tax=Paenibacillus cremeus TaxID=2163881 RepID=A0A559K4W9_9BACL|nr:ABC transporter permease subunit [Paenibacillus cremeus]TVY07181.1 sugar ABC transporter permease [Paenibacillus cremeus]
MPEVNIPISTTRTHPQIKLTKLIAKIIRDRYLLLMLLPGLVYFLIFKYGPMYGIVIAFKNYSIFRGISGSPWVGLDNFVQFFQSPEAPILIRNTFLISFYNILFGFPAPILLAIAFNELTGKYVKRITQSVTFLPHFISTVVIAGLVVNFLSPETGIINKLLHTLFGVSPINFMMDPQYFRPVYVLMNIWKDIGWGSIIYLAALTGISSELYESAKLDGANRWRQTWHITLPGILPTIVIMLVLQIGRLMEVGAESIILLYNPSTYDTADVLSTYVYRRGLVGTDYSFAAAVDLFNSVVGIVLILIANRISRKVTDHSLW